MNENEVENMVQANTKVFIHTKQQEKNVVKEKFIYLIREHHLTPTKAAKQLSISQRTTNRWFKQAFLIIQHNDYTSVKTKATLKKRLSREKRNDFSTLEERYHWAMRWLIQTDMNFTKNCIFVGKTRFCGPDYTALALCAFHAQGIVNIHVINKKYGETEQEDENDLSSFLQHTLDVLDQNNDRHKNYYIVIQYDLIEMDIARRGYTCVCLPPFSPELNPMEHFWSACRLKLKKTLCAKNMLISKIADICKRIKLTHLESFCLNSSSNFDHCINKRLI
ncbi:uncharacterized protein B0P05DRAFT_587247 [Gilbertella persicaria]|nr:uncharacterized protein B0P05DRAFT_587247 [Gilbertella persicaria]KAI8079015.1 hypothetical protein B0P05DRAFT_587247 [Gilbertella persicaria]